MGDTAENTQYDFFISFAEDAKEWVYGVLVPKLGRTGKTFVLMGEITGNAWVEDLQANIEASQKILVVVTPQYCTSQRNHLLQLMAFTKGAEHREWPVVPLLLKSVDLELFLRFINGVNLTQYQSEEQLDALFAVPPRSQEEQQQLDGSPYPGMKTFEEEDASRFFGREEEIDRYVKALRNEHILVLTGASGCGKSSLARAGIIPRLKAKHQFLVKTVRPIDKDLDNWLEQAENALKHGDESTKQFFSLKQPDQSFLLFIDQFEELFSTEPDERSNFILSMRAKQLLGLLVKLKKQVPNFYLLITLRAEFYPQLALCQAYLDFDNYLQRINALSREGLTNAITKPALKKYVYIDERLVERLVSEAGDDPGILPFVQETLRDLWDKRYENYISLEAYESLGGNAGSGLKASIAAKADAAYKALTSIDKEHRLEKENITKRIFLRLIQFGEGKPDTRRQQSISELRSDQDTQGVFEETLRHLSSEKYRLLTVSRGDDDEDSKVDIVHEALIKAWPKLQEWMKSYKELEEKRRIFYFKLKEWQRFGQTEAGLLDKYEVKEIKDIFDKKSSESYIFLFSSLAENFLEKSILKINPNWNKRGIALILVLLLSFIFLIFYLLLLVDDIASKIIQIVVYIIFIVLLFIIFYFYYYIRKNESYFEQKVSHQVSKGYKFSVSIFFVFLLTLGIWSAKGVDLYKLKNECSPLLKNNLKNILINFDSEFNDVYKILISDFLEKKFNINIILVDEKNLLFCGEMIKDSFSIKENTIENKKGVIDHVFSLYRDGKEIESTKLFNQNEKCAQVLKLGILLAKQVKENVDIKQNEEISNESCKLTMLGIDALEKYRNGDFKGAESFFLRKIQEEPMNASHKNEIAILYLTQEDKIKKAYEYAKEALTIDVKFDYLITLAKACRLLGDYQCSEKYLQQAMSLDSNRPELYNEMALLHKSRMLPDAYEKSLSYIQRAIAFADCEGRVLLDCYAFRKNRAVINYSFGNADAAINELLELEKYSSESREEVYFYLFKIFNASDRIKSCAYSLKYKNEKYIPLPDRATRSKEVNIDSLFCDN